MVVDMIRRIDANTVSDFLIEHEVTEPIMIERQGVPHAVMVPYEVFRIMHRQNRRAMQVGELTKDEIQDIVDSKPSSDSNKYNDELDD
ncbi:MAG: hypothetical protein DBO99_19725 [gamma proteobacterium symbiont of Ctena orbiculata]|nr:MAG: hypothetical protein DBO99_19725 [gamma proteobacterium symbiont of Ctena orbiculata]